MIRIESNLNPKHFVIEQVPEITLFTQLIRKISFECQMRHYLFFHFVGVIIFIVSRYLFRR